MPVLGIFVLVAIIVIATNALKRGGKKKLPYTKARFLSEAELPFFGVLEHLIDPTQFRIFAKVRLADLLNVESGLDNSAHTTAQNKINSKHVDFVLCTTSTIEPVCVIELDDKSHNRPDRKKRDAFVDEALNSAGLPIVHIRNAKNYKTDVLVQQIETALNS